MNDTLFDYGAPVATASGGGIPLFAIVVVGFVILIILIALIMVARRALFRPEMHGLTPEEIRRRWDEIEKISVTGLMGAKMAIVEADKLLDGALKSMTMAGETLGERLKFASYKYPELRKVWPAHKLRNQIVHEATFDVSHGQAKTALQEFKKALRTLHVL